MVRLPCPIPGYDETGEDEQPRYYVDAPDEWRGLHSVAYWESREATEGSKLSPDQKLFVSSLALLDGFELPGLSGKPENWDYDKMPLKIIAWVNYVAVDSYVNCFEVKKNWSRP